MKRKVLIFADLTHKIGTGHFWRCARLASRLAGDRQEEVAFLLPKNERALALIEIFNVQNKHAPINFQFVKGISNHRKDEKIIAPLPDAVVNAFPSGFDLALIDCHRISPQQFLTLKKKNGTVILIDDLKHRDLTRDHVDLIINPTLPSSELSYGDVPTLQPPNFHFLPATFFQDRPRNPNSVFIAFSGVDFGQISIFLLQIMKAIDPHMGNPDLRFKVAVNDMSQIFSSCATDLSQSLGRNRFEVVTNYNAAKELGEAGMVVCAGGQISFESSAAGAPLACVTHISKPTALLSDFFRKQNVPYGDLYGIIKGNDVSPKLYAVADTLLKVFHDRSAVTVARPNAQGMKNLINVVKSAL